MPPLRSTQLRKLGQRAQLAVKYERLARARQAPIETNTVLYESFSGNGMLCNPEAIFRAALAAPDLAHLRHTWALSDVNQYASTIAEFEGDDRVQFVETESPAYYTALARSQYLINNSTFPTQFGKRDGQTYLNTWHGTPLKAMGYDIPAGAVDTRNIVRNFVNADYLLAPNEATAQMYLTAYRMRNLYRGRIIREGTPRIDRQFVSAADRSAIIGRLREHGVTIADGQQLVLYAPTWKGNFYAPTNDMRQLRARLEDLSARIDTTRYRVLLKVHQQVYRYAIQDKDLQGALVPNEMPTNEVLAATDVLVTDYSSIFMDFLATGNPILFYAPDIDQYAGSRGLYLPIDEWPGPVCRDIEGLAREISALHTGTPDDPVHASATRYAAARERYVPDEDGKATERVLDIVFRGRDDAYRAYRVDEGFSDGRVPILIHLGGMLANGITTSALCLLDNIDHSRYDVTVTYRHTSAPARRKLIDSINPAVRHFPRVGGINGSKLAVYRLLRIQGSSTAQFRRAVARHRGLLHDEWVRCFGASRFEHVIDFSGYSPFWAQLFTQRSAGSLSVWMHNDLRAESENSEKSARHRANLRGVFALYRQADSLVSVSPALAEVNREKLAEFAPAAKFTYARNSINFERIRYLAYGSEEADGPESIAVADPSASFDAADLRGSVEQLIARHGMEHVRDTVARRATIAELLPPIPGVRTFVTAGRLSNEKNHERMIKAFDAVHQTEPDTRLIILGTGVLYAKLAKLVDDLGLTDAVTLAGYQESPFGVLANSDCFVLSSDYEGQPMVLLEALVLGLPVVTTEFGSVRGVLPDGYGRIVPRTVDGLAAGMRAFLAGEVRTAPFDYVAYNRDATEEFYRAIGAREAV